MIKIVADDHSPLPQSRDQGWQLCRTQGESPVKIIELAHSELLQLCASLEEIADSLPETVDTALCADVAAKLVPLTSDVHRFEETILFPWLEQRYPERQNLLESLRRLKSEHLEDEGYADEISETLLRLTEHERVQPETVGYMLRGFFEGMRRHISTEREYLYELLDG
jgi:hemerythrin-like domain-containing protein